MDTPSKTARVFVVDGSNRDLLCVQLKGGLVLARMDKPNRQFSVHVESPCLTKVSADLDGNPVLHTDDCLPPGNHVLTNAGFKFVPGTAVAPESAVQPVLGETDQYLRDLGVEVEADSAPVPKPYIGSPGGVLTLRLGYFVQDNGEFVPDRGREGDTLVIKLNTVADFDHAIASNLHRIEVPTDPEHPETPVCGTCHLHGDGQTH
jgi:hypothetical protein